MNMNGTLYTYYWNREQVMALKKGCSGALFLWLGGTRQYVMLYDSWASESDAYVRNVFCKYFSCCHREYSLQSILYIHALLQNVEIKKQRQITKKCITTSPPKNSG